MTDYYVRELGEEASNRVIMSACLPSDAALAWVKANRPKATKVICLVKRADEVKESHLQT